MSGQPAVGGVSVRGASHLRSRMPNQDALAHRQDGGWSILAVADGHGSARHYRSDRGAAFAVETATDLLRSVALHVPPDMMARVLPTLAGDLVAGWRQRVEADIRSFPVRERPGFESHAVYGSTCIAAAIGPGLSVFLQVGDGDAFAAGPGGDLQRTIPLDPSLVGPATYSLCQPDAVQRVRVRSFADPHPLSRPRLVFLATDGLSTSYPRDEEFQRVIRDLGGSITASSLPDVLARIEPWLADCSRRGSGDDVTVAVYVAVESEPIDLAVSAFAAAPRA